MIIYIIGFLISTLLLLLSSKVIKSQQFLLVFLALLIPCCIAGFRAESIGTDVYTYLSPMTEAAISADNWADYMSTGWFRVYRYLYVSDYEIGFSVFVYIVAKIFRSIYAVQFAIQAITVIPIYMACSKLKPRIPIWLCMLTYYCMIFNTSLNLMRQTIGMAFVFLGYVYFVCHENKKCVIATCIAVAFHTSALLSLAIYFIHWFVNKDITIRNLKTGQKKSSKYLSMLLVIAGGTFLIVGTNTLGNILSSLGFQKYVGYIQGELTFMPNQLISRLPVFALFIFVWKKFKNKNTNMRFLFTMLCFDLLCAQFTSVNSFGGRVALYFSEFQMLTYPAIYMETRKNKIILLLSIAYMSFYWWFYFVYSGANATIPYMVGF